ncbi:MAG: 23S rRNA (pseudouridine(1915)-N(3))-methyltransferase RlmH [Eubacteriales bacterium]|nr:23S rRNA (pseudouridine(1915)-N(3))-methyltransferase RlmH [Eubacteriales bacterium]
MLSVNIICIGTLKEKYLKDAVKEYATRLAPFCRFGISELPEYKLPQKPSPAQIEKAIEDEGKRILEKISKNSYVIPMCIEGKTLSSEALSTKIDSVALEGKSTVDFIIGGSFGLSDEVKKKGDFRLSMSPMTFPHQLARVMLCEQIYRSFQISTGGKYHK